MGPQNHQSSPQSRPQATHPCVRHPFPKAIRLRTRQQYKRLQHPSNRYVGRWICIDYKPNNHHSVTRLGITVTKKFGKAHDRNRFKRIIREAFRLCYPELPLGLDMNVKPRSEAAQAKLDDIIQDLKNMKS